MRSVDQFNYVGSCGQNLKVSKIAFDNLKLQQELTIAFPKMVENLIILLFSLSTDNSQGFVSK